MRIDGGVIADTSARQSTCKMWDGVKIKETERLCPNPTLIPIGARKERGRDPAPACKSRGGRASLKMPFGTHLIPENIVAYLAGILIGGEFDETIIVRAAHWYS